MKSFFSHTTYATDEPDLPAKDNDEKRLLNDLRLTRTELEKAIEKLEKEMKEASKRLEFEYAAVLRDRLIELRKEPR